MWASGSPIFIKDNRKIIGVHFGTDKHFLLNYGTLITGPINKFNEKYNQKNIKINKNNDKIIKNNEIKKINLTKNKNYKNIKNMRVL